MSKNITRRDFLKGVAAAGAGIGLSSLMGCSTSDAGESARQASTAAETAAAGTAAPSTPAEDTVQWDDEAEIVIVGSGTGLFAALFASHTGHSAIVLEKAGLVGGTTMTSGAQVWVPCNRWAEEVTGSEWTEEQAFAYMKAGDLYNGTTDEARWDYIHNMHKIMEYMEDEMNYPLMVMRGYGEYDKVSFGQPEGHSIGFANRENGERIRPAQLIPEYMIPEIEAAGNKILTDTAAKRLIQDTSGNVIGVYAEGADGTSMNIKAANAVILAAGGFDRNEEMCRAFLRGPLFGSMVAAGNTGDGILMGMAVGGNLGNMQNTLGGNVYLDEYEPGTFFEHNMGFDFGSYRANAYTMIVNKHGRRFMDESVPYSNFPDAAYNFDTNDHSFTNIPAYLIFTEKEVELNGWPVGDTQPDWVHKFDTLDELAEFYKINAENLKEEIKRFNGFAETGIDTDYSRGTNPWSLGMAPQVEGLVNSCIGTIEAPYYVCMIAPGSLGTKGGLKTTLDAQVVNVFGNPIGGLYAVGTNASAVMGWTYGGGGGGVGPGVFQSFKAINHIFRLGLFDAQ